MIEAKCRTCGETFIPSDADDLDHIERADGASCMGPGEIVAAYEGDVARTAPVAPVRFEILMRTKTHHAAGTTTGGVRCDCGRESRTIEALALRHARTPRVMPGIRRIPFEVGDVVTVHTGTRAYDVTEVSAMDGGWARIWPQDDDEGTAEGKWVSVGQLRHVPAA